MRLLFAGVGLLALAGCAGGGSPSPPPLPVDPNIAAVAQLNAALAASFTITDVVGIPALVQR